MATRRNVISFAASCAVLAAFASATPVTMAQEARLPVVASFSILGDLVRQLGGERVTVIDLVGPNEESHGFEPGPRHVKQIAAAKLLVVNGLGYEPYFEKLRKSAGVTLAPVVASTGIAPMAKPKATSNHGHSHGKEGSDPHAWQSVRNVRTYAQNIAHALIAADPAGKAHYNARLADYLAALDALERDIATAIATIPSERRMLVTTHNAFRYLGRDAGLRTEALQGVSAETEPSAADMASIIRQLKALKAPAVFLENVSDPRKMEQIARESGAKIGGTLYSDALSVANGPAATYIDMMRHNMRQIVDALK